MLTATTEIESALCIAELAWHFTACKIKDGTTLKPCLFKELRKQILLVRNRL
jgi:hypothetical protein